MVLLYCIVYVFCQQWLLAQETLELQEIPVFWTQEVEMAAHISCTPGIPELVSNAGLRAMVASPEEV